MTSQHNQITYYLVADSKINIKGLVKIYLRFLNKGEKTDFFTGIRWRKELFDQENQVLLPRLSNDIDVEAHNLVLAQQKSIVHKVHLDSYMDGRSFSVEAAIEAIRKFKPVGDFVSFSNKETNNDYNKDVIGYQTWRNHRTAIHRFIEFWESHVIPFADITTDKLKEYDAYLKKRGKAHNTITGYHKVLRKYLNLAINRNLIKKNPYEGLTFRYVDGNRHPLTQAEVKKLRLLFYTEILEPMEKEILRRFLFSCLTGIRISDTHRLHRNMITDNVLEFKPKKNLRFGKINRIPLPSAALELIEGRDNFFFASVSDKHINQMLKIIAAKAGIKKHLTYHCARDTFGTIFIELGGDIKSLCDIMGHSDTRITEIYLKMSDKRKQNLMNNFDQLFD
ncbi:MAG: site-specific integrase [Pseudosphingobacterium sp.]|nr:site-specific integrase [Pseudosphingobacterium sp.]